MRQVKVIHQDLFLDAYQLTGSMDVAASKAGVGRFNHYRWMKDIAYAKRYHTIRKALGARLEGAVFDRALNGVIKPVYFEGKRVDADGESREYDSRREQMVLRALLPDEYGAKLEVSVKDLPKANLDAEIVALYSEAEVVDAEFSVSEGEGDPQGQETPPGGATSYPPPPQKIPPS